MAKAINRIGFGQVEPNHMSMQQTGQIYAQRPAKAGITQLENGQFVKYSVDKVTGKEEVVTDAAGLGEWMMVFNEVKLYGDTYNETYKDYAMQAKNFTDGEIVPRVVKTNVGDLFTTNCFAVAGKYREACGTVTTLSVGDVVTVGANGFLVKKIGDAATEIEFTVVKEYTMADGQDAVKLQRTK